MKKIKLAVLFLLLLQILEPISVVGDSISASEEIISHEDTSRENVFDVVDSTVTSSSNETSDNTVPSGSSSSESNSSLMEDSSQQDVQNETTDTSFEENDIAGTSTRIDRYSAYIVKEKWNIWADPYTANGSQPISNTDQYIGEEIQVIDEKSTNFGTYILFQIKRSNEYKTVGWLNVLGISKHTISINKSSGIAINQTLRIYKSTWSIWSLPYDERAQLIGKTDKLYEKVIRAVRKATTQNGVYLLIEYNGETIGWINENGTGKENMLDSNIGESYSLFGVYQTKYAWSIWSKPFVKGGKNQFVKYSNAYAGEKVDLIRRARTNNGIYVLFKFDGKEIGWINETAINSNLSAINTSEGVTISNTYGKILKSNWSILEKPYKSEAKELGKTTSYLNKQVLFNARATTNTGTYLKTWIMVNGRWHFVGWINELGTTYVDKIITNKSVNYDMHMVSKKNWSLWETPYIYGAKESGKTTFYLGKNVSIIRESKTSYGTYYQLKYRGRIIGWINKEGLSNLKEFIVPIDWVNQINTAGYAGAGCAASQIFATMQAKGYALNLNLRWFYNNLPLHSWNPDIGQVGHPLRYNEFKAVISPIGTTNFINKLGGNAVNITGKPLTYVQNEVKQGNPVMIWGKAGLRYPNNNSTTHVLTIIGYKNGKYFIQDPASGYINSGGRQWVAEKTLDNYLSIKGRKQVVVR